MRDSNRTLTATLIPFPLANRTGKVRDVAGKMLATRTERQADHYRSQISEALIHKLRGIGAHNDDIADQLAAFWHRVNMEMARLSPGTHKGGAA